MTSSSSAQRRPLLTDWIERGPHMVCVDDTPESLLPLISALSHAQPRQLSTNDPPAREIADRQAAVLILLGHSGPDRVDVLLTQRASGLRDHPGEISFPGGSWEPGDTSPVGTALREAAEETGVDPGRSRPIASSPAPVHPSVRMRRHSGRRILAPTQPRRTDRSRRNSTGVLRPPE